MILGLGRSPGEGIGYLRQYSWAFLVAEAVKNLPAMWETWVQSLSWGDPMEEGMATHCSPWGLKESDMTERLSTAQLCLVFPRWCSGKESACQ